MENFFVRVNYKFKDTLIMKTFRIRKSEVDKLSDKELEQFIYDTLCNQKQSDEVYLMNMILCDEDDNIIKQLL